jgi:hypothetical protein
MDSRRMLVAISATQLAVGLAGAITSVRRGHSYDLLWFRGNPARLAAEALTIGTALSAPSPMLLSQAMCTVVLAARPDRRAAAGLQILGTMMVGGYLIERLGQRRLSPSGWEPLETPLVVAGTGLAVAMAVLGRRARRS